MNAKHLTCDALMLALLIICSQLTIPLPVIPLTLQTLAVGIIASLLTVSDTCLILTTYLLAGSIGLPVFSNFTGGLAVILSPLGGYIIGFLIYGLITSGWLTKSSFLTSYRLFEANLLGASVQLIIGAGWLKIWEHQSWLTAFMTGVFPFIIPALIKIYLVIFITKRLQLILFSLK